MTKKSACALWVLLFISVGCSGSRPANLGVTDGMLAPCPPSPNCVSTQSEDKARSLTPIAYTSSQEEAKEKETFLKGKIQQGQTMETTLILADI